MKDTEIKTIQLSSGDIKNMKIGEDKTEEQREKEFLKESLIRIRNDLDFLMDSYKKFESRAKYDIETLNQSFHKNLDNYLARLANTIMKNINLQLEEEATKSIKDLIDHIARRERFIEEMLQEIRKTNTKKIHLDLTMDGYEMVKRTPCMDEIEMSKLAQYNADEAINMLLKPLASKERLVLMHRFGLLGEKSKTLEETGKILGLSREPVRLQEKRALRKLRHPERKHLIDHITHKKLREALLGE